MIDYRERAHAAVDRVAEQSPEALEFVEQVCWDLLDEPHPHEGDGRGSSPEFAAVALAHVVSAAYGAAVSHGRLVDRPHV